MALGSYGFESSPGLPRVIKNVKGFVVSLGGGLRPSLKFILGTDFQSVPLHCAVGGVGVRLSVDVAWFHLNSPWLIPGSSQRSQHLRHGVSPRGP